MLRGTATLHELETEWSFDDLMRARDLLAMQTAGERLMMQKLKQQQR